MRFLRLVTVRRWVGYVRSYIPHTRCGCVYVRTFTCCRSAVSFWFWFVAAVVMRLRSPVAFTTFYDTRCGWILPDFGYVVQFVTLRFDFTFYGCTRLCRLFTLRCLYARFVPHTLITVTHGWLLPLRSRCYRLPVTAVTVTLPRLLPFVGRSGCWFPPHRYVCYRSRCVAAFFGLRLRLFAVVWFYALRLHWFATGYATLHTAATVTPYAGFLPSTLRSVLVTFTFLVCGSAVGYAFCCGYATPLWVTLPLPHYCRFSCVWFCTHAVTPTVYRSCVGYRAPHTTRLRTHFTFADCGYGCACPVYCGCYTVHAPTHTVYLGYAWPLVDLPRMHLPAAHCSTRGSFTFAGCAAVLAWFYSTAVAWLTRCDFTLVRFVHCRVG